MPREERRIIIHGGCGKTGSSSIQLALAEISLSGAFRHHGCFYPLDSPHNDNLPWLDSYMSKIDDLFWNERAAGTIGNLRSSQLLVDSRLHLERLSHRDATVLLSSEVVSNSSLFAKHTLAYNLLSLYDDISLLFYVRNPFYYLLKCGAQQIISGMGLSDYLSYPYLNGQSHALGVYQEHVSGESFKMSVFSYEEACQQGNGSIVPHFLATLEALLQSNIDSSTIDLDSKVNQSYPGLYYYLLARLNDIIDTRDSFDAGKIATKANAIGKINSFISKNDSGCLALPPLWPSSDLKGKILSASLHDADMLHQIYGLDYKSSLDHIIGINSEQLCLFYDRVASECSSANTIEQLLEIGRNFAHEADSF